MELSVTTLKVWGRLTETLTRLVFKQSYCLFNPKCQRQTDGLTFPLRRIPK